MKQMLFHKTNGKLILLVCLFLLMQTSLVWAAEDITGDWKMTMDTMGQASVSTLSITKKADGTLAGKWGSSDLADVKFEDGKLSFVRKFSFADQEIIMNFKGTLKDGKITGTMSSDNGDSPVTGIRKKPKCPALGQWDLRYDVMGQTINAKLTISQAKDESLECKWKAERGEHTISEMKFQDGKLTFKRKSSIEGYELESTFSGTIKGNEMTGTLKSDLGDVEAKGTRCGTALIGTWEMTATTDYGIFKNIFAVDIDMTGTYELFGSEIPVKNMKLEGDQLAFEVETEFGIMSYKGKLDGKTIKGKIESDYGTSDVTGKKMEKAKTPASEPKTGGN